MKTTTYCGWMALLLVAVPLLLACPTWAQESETFKAEDLDQMLAPIALYPDPLLAQVLMACTYPAEVAEAAQWSQSNAKQKGDAAVTAVQGKPWDPSVKSLVAFPQALATMDKEPEWVQKVGDAFLAQPNDVMDSVQRLRAAAQQSGNLESNAQQKVIVEEAPQTQQTIIKIEPANPQVVYVPAYNPTVVYGTWWYPSYPPVYLPPPPGYVFGTALVSGIAFGIGVGITNSLWGGCDWGRGDVDIDINHYNNINVGNKLEVNQNKVKWNHNAEHRREVPYRDAKTRATHSKPIAGADQRRDFRGREADRDKAQAALQQRGIDPAKGREKLRTDPQTRERAQAATRPVDPGKARASASKIDRDQARAATPNIDRDKARPATQRRGSDNAFKGAQSPSQTQQNISRGRSSRQAVKAPAGGRRRQ
ncbi:MAG: DUF3300 domain-containing protein [Desulfobacterales bacterium]|nr:DUF3300 domain-containing protein [Desulfobacterales bacterium]